MRLRAAAESARLRDEPLAGERLGRLKERFWRASHAFDVTIRKRPEPIGRKHPGVSWSRNEKFHDWSQLVDGRYLLRTNLTGVDPATLWRRSIQLTAAEWAFRTAKDALANCLVWYQQEVRVRSHVLICFLVYAMWKTLARWLTAARLGNALLGGPSVKSEAVFVPVDVIGGRSVPLRFPSDAVLEIPEDCPTPVRLAIEMLAGASQPC